jgi:hypothetical protein
MATPRKFLPDGSPVPMGRRKGQDTMAAYALVPTENIIHKPGPKPKPKKAKAWHQAQRKKPGSLPKPSPESNEMREAFHAYLAMGDGRSLERLALELDKSVATLKAWSQKYGWVNRVLTHEEENADTLLIENVAEQQEKRKFGLKLLDKILRDTVTLNEDGSIAKCSVEAKTPSDIRTLLTLREELLNPEKGSKTLGKGSQINAENAVFIIKK